MPKNRPPTTGYARIQDFSDDEDDNDNDYLANSRASLPPASTSRYASITQPKPHAGMHSDGSTSPGVVRRPRDRRRMRSNSSGIDIKAINARLEKWADEIASKFKINKDKSKPNTERLEIHHSVFQPPDGIRPATAEDLALDGDSDRTSKADFDAVVESVKTAIQQGVHPKMISQGSSGSYFARNSEGEVVGVFKPRDEEPYGAANPKLTKFIHRTLFPCFFGRSCLIPASAVFSEAAARVLDTGLRTNLVPYTDLVNLSSSSFHYGFWDRRSYYRKKKQLPPKLGSFQVFLKGFKDANIFLRENPWPDHSNGAYMPTDLPAKKKKPWRDMCRPSSSSSNEPDAAASSPTTSTDGIHDRRFTWTDALQQSFREELEKLVILDYIMRNTDRGLDNWMIKVDWEKQNVAIAAEPPDVEGNSILEPAPRPVPAISDDHKLPHSPLHSYKTQEPMNANSVSNTPPGANGPKMTIGAIDNSLSWPWKHPDAWRSFPFGWLFLPVSLIGQPFSAKTRDHFLPLLTSKQWWSDLQLDLRRVFSQDADFQERMFARQIAVMKGQAWNVAETLKTADHGPLELTMRSRVCVWDDLVDIPIAVPMRVPSTEMRRRTDLASDKHLDEMDISAANSSTPQPDLLGLSDPPTELPNPNRLDSASPRVSEDAIGFHPSEPSSSLHLPAGLQGKTTASNGQVKFSERPRPDRFKGHMSYAGPSNSSLHPGRESRRFSYSSKSRGAVQMLYDGDDHEGDLGYAAAEGMEGNQRKVFMERLETVRSKNPVFTWC